MYKRDSRRLSPAAQEELRFRAVMAVENGATRTEASRLLGVPRQTIGQWVAAYRSGGEDALRSRVRGRRAGEVGKLSARQAKVIAGIVRDRCPDQVKLPFLLWTREAVADLILRKYGIEVSRWTAGRYLKAWGFTPQKPVRRALERNEAEVRRWLTEEYPRIRAEARQEGAQIFWGDEMGLRSDHAVGRTYGVKGVTPVIRKTGQRFGCNMISAITNQGALSFMVYRENFTVAVFLNFLDRLIRRRRRRVYLIVDGHPVHRANLVREWLEAHETQIRVIRLPGYSPELNPDEMLNQDVKANALKHKRPRNKDELVSSLTEYMEKRKGQPGVIRNFFHEQHVLYAAA